MFVNLLETHPGANLLMAKCNMEIGDFEAALVNIEIAEEENPSDPRITAAKLGVLKKMNAPSSRVAEALIAALLNLIKLKINPMRVKMFAGLQKIVQSDLEEESNELTKSVLKDNGQGLVESLGTVICEYKTDPSLASLEEKERPFVEDILEVIFRHRVVDQQDSLQFLMDHSAHLSKQFLKNFNSQVEAYLRRNESLLERTDFLNFVLKMDQNMDMEVLDILKLKYGLFGLEDLTQMSRPNAETPPKLRALQTSIVSTFAHIFRIIGLNGIINSPSISLAPISETQHSPDYPATLSTLETIAHYLYLKQPDDQSPNSPFTPRASLSDTNVVQLLSKSLERIDKVQGSFSDLRLHIWSVCYFGLLNLSTPGLLLEVRAPRLLFDNHILHHEPLFVNFKAEPTSKDISDLAPQKIIAIKASLLSKSFGSLTRFLGFRESSPEWIYLFGLASFSNLGSLFDHLFPAFLPFDSLTSRQVLQAFQKNPSVLNKLSSDQKLRR